MWPLGQLAAKLFNQPGFADAGLTDNQDELSGASKSAFRAASQDCEVLFPADERGEKLWLSPAPSAAYPQDAIEIHWRKGALELMGALVLNDEQPSNLPLDRRSDQHRPRLGRCLNSRGNVGNLAEHLARGVDDCGTAFEADADGKLRAPNRSVSGVNLAKRPLDAKSGPNSAFCVILLRAGIAEDGHHPIAKHLKHVAAEFGHRLRGLVEIAVEESAQILSVESGCKFGRADKIAEHDCDRTSFGGIQLREGRGR